MTAIDERIAGRTLSEWRAFARRDDCLERMVPSDLRQILQALRPGSTGETEGWVLVPKDALRWLNGEHEDGFERPADARGNFWWRTEFKRRAMLSAAGGDT